MMIMEMKICMLIRTIEQERGQGQGRGEGRGQEQEQEQEHTPKILL